MFNDLFSCYPPWREIRCLARHGGWLRQGGKILGGSELIIWASSPSPGTPPEHSWVTLTRMWIIIVIDTVVVVRAGGGVDGGRQRWKRWIWYSPSPPSSPPLLQQKELCYGVSEGEWFSPTLFVVYCVMASSLPTPHLTCISSGLSSPHKCQL